MTSTKLRLALASLLLIACAPLVEGCAVSTDEGADSSEAELALSSSKHTAYNYFRAKGLTSFQAAAIVGNLMQESNVEPKAIQYGNGPGRGIAQWSVGGRWNHDSGDNVVTYAAHHGVSPWALQTQLDFIWYELTSFSSYGLGALKASNTLSDAVVAFQDRFEGCGTCNQSGRIADAKQVLAAFGGGGGGGTAACWSGTLGKSVPTDTCVESKYDKVWYQCNDGSWIDRWTDPDPCKSVHPL